MSDDVAAGFGDLLEELQAEIDFALGCEKAQIGYEPSNDILELLIASRAEIERLRARVDELEDAAYDAYMDARERDEKS